MPRTLPSLANADRTREGVIDVLKQVKCMSSQSLHHLLESTSAPCHRHRHCHRHAVAALALVSTRAVNRLQGTRVLETAETTTRNMTNDE
jgi:hypothetical protein